LKTLIKGIKIYLPTWKNFPKIIDLLCNEPIIIIFTPSFSINNHKFKEKLLIKRGIEGFWHVNCSIIGVVIKMEINKNEII